MTSYYSSSRKIIIFGRYPVPGNTKTRLIDALGPAGAAEIQRILTKHIVSIAKEAAEQYGCRVEVCFEGGDINKMRNWLGSDVTFYPQENKDLGIRMYLAFQHAFQRGAGQVILLGTDIPDITPDYIGAAFDSLKTSDLVLGPSSDGGYFLIGMNRILNVFHDIPWSTPQVLNKTQYAAKDQGLDVTILDPMTDIDTIDDLKLQRPELAVKKPYVSVIIPALNEAENIESTIVSAKDDDAEIIVVDGGSTDSTVEKARNTGAMVIQSPPGRSMQQNNGAAIAGGRILLFLHADTILPKDYLKKVFDAMMDPNVILGAFRFKTDYDHPIMKGIEFVTNLRARYLQLPYGDQGLFMRKKTFDEMGGFPDVAIAEDLFFVRTLLKKGQLKMLSNAVITSARRWRKVGLLHTFLINQLIVLGCYTGIPASRLSLLYKSSRR